jgi:thymidylate synthase (FAD)
MNIELVSFTNNPIETCAKAAYNCTNTIEMPEHVDPHGLVERVLTLGHESIAEFADFVFKADGISRVASHQLVRHRVASYAQQSQRYNTYDTLSINIPDGLSYEQAEKMKQAASYCHNLYLELLSEGVPGEAARYILPNAATSSIFIKMNARELRHFFSLRLCLTTQTEIRFMAQAMYEIVRRKFPALFVGQFPPCETKGECKSCPGVNKNDSTTKIRVTKPKQTKPSNEAQKDLFEEV